MQAAALLPKQIEFVYPVSSWRLIEDQLQEYLLGRVGLSPIGGPSFVLMSCDRLSYPRIRSVFPSLWDTDTKTITPSTDGETQ